MNISEQDRTQEKKTLAPQIDLVGWGLFFIWVGIGFLTNFITWGMGLLGVGIIALGTQAARKYFALRVEQFSLAIGVLFVVAGVLMMLNIEQTFAPILVIVAGALMVIFAFPWKQRHA